MGKLVDSGALSHNKGLAETLTFNSGGASKYHGGLGRYMEEGAQPSHKYEFSTIFDRDQCPSRGHKGSRVQLKFPGGAGCRLQTHLGNEHTVPSS